MKEVVGSDLGQQWERETTVRVMTAYVAHELNQPLGSIINLSNTLSRHLARSVIRPQDIDEQIKSIKAEAIRATTIIKHLRLLTERRPTTKARVSLVEVCQEAISWLKPLTLAKRIRVRLWVCTGQVHVNGAKALLATALQNLLLNSIAALDDPAIANRRLMIRIAAATQERTAIEVFDNGCGLPEGIGDRIFEPFVTARPGGSGLGLAIAGDIVRWHRGHIACRSRRHGTCMTLNLPTE